MVRLVWPVRHSDERLVAGQRVERDERRRRGVGGIVESRDRGAGRLVEGVPATQRRRGPSVDLERDVAVHDVADDAARVGVAARLMGRTQGDAMGFDAVDPRVERAGQQMLADDRPVLS